MNKKKPVFFLVLAVAILMVYTALFGLTIPMGNDPIRIKGAPDMRYGIDIRGGVKQPSSRRDWTASLPVMSSNQQEQSLRQDLMHRTSWTVM
jgi:preprotein translocase subunit SecD